MNRLLEELKVRARVQRNGHKRAGAAGQGSEEAKLRLRDCLHDVARQVGFAHWEHARRVLGGLAAPGEDMGAFWYAPACRGLLNGWFARREEALAAQAARPGGVVLPYRHQFMVVDSDFIQAIGLDPRDPAWAEAGHDLDGAYGREAWLALAERRLRMPTSQFEAVRAALPRR